MDIKKIALQNDDRIYNMAVYHATKGMTIAVAAEDLLDEFRKMKEMLKSENISIDELEDDIYSDYGVVWEDAISVSVLPQEKFEKHAKREELSHIIRECQFEDLEGHGHDN